MWQPISTAPRDGTKVWAWLYDSGIRQVRFVSAEQSAAGDGGKPEDYIDCWLDGEGDDWGPAFWAPLDAIPVPAGVVSVKTEGGNRWRDADKLPCVFCGQPIGSDGISDDNGETACKECGEAELATQAKEHRA